jgi:hypothetical protein
LSFLTTTTSRTRPSTRNAPSSRPAHLRRSLGSSLSSAFSNGAQLAVEVRPASTLSSPPSVSRRPLLLRLHLIRPTSVLRLRLTAQPSHPISYSYSSSLPALLRLLHPHTQSFAYHRSIQTDTQTSHSPPVPQECPTTTSAVTCLSSAPKRWPLSLSSCQPLKARSSATFSTKQSHLRKQHLLRPSRLGS